MIDDSLSLSPEITYNRFTPSAYVIGSSFVSDGLLRRKERKGNCLCYNGLKGRTNHTAISMVCKACFVNKDASSVCFCNISRGSREIEEELSISGCQKRAQSIFVHWLKGDLLWIAHPVPRLIISGRRFAVGLFLLFGYSSISASFCSAEHSVCLPHIITRTAA